MKKFIFLFALVALFLGAIAQERTVNVNTAAPGNTYVTYTGTSSDILMSVTVDAVGEMLGVATKKATAKLIGIIDTVSPNNLMQIRLSIYDNDIDAWNTISVGHFLV